MTLSPDQLQAIDRHLRGLLHETKWPRQEQFLAEMTDHYTDSILAKLGYGDPFELALKNTFDSFGQAKGIRSLEMNYWRLYSRNVWWQLFAYFTFPRLLITLPLIGLVIVAKLNGVFMSILPRDGWASYLPSFQTLLFGSNALNLIAWLLRVRSREPGSWQPFFQRIAPPVTTVAKWIFFIFIVELFSNPLMVGKASPYLAAFLYAAGIIFHLNRLTIERSKGLPSQPTR